MQAEEIFQNLKETNLLEKLKSKRNLLFVGDEETIRYLASELGSRHVYWTWPLSGPAHSIDIDALGGGVTIVVASVKNERAIYQDLNRYLDSLGIRLCTLKLFDDAFVNLMSGRKLLGSSDCEVVPPHLSYAVVATPRSGSTFLCEILRSTGIAGYPVEHLRQPSVVLAIHCKFDYLRYLRIIRTYRMTENGVFGTKFISHFLRALERGTDSDFGSIFHAYISKVIHLVRRDRIAQAVSVVMARKTSVWHVFDKKMQNEYRERLQELEFTDEDLGEVNRYHQHIIDQEAYLERLFQTYRLSPLVVEYEKLLDSPEMNIRMILEYLGVSYNQRQIIVQSNARKLRSTLSDRIIERYKEKYLGDDST